MEFVCMIAMKRGKPSLASGSWSKGFFRYSVKGAQLLLYRTHDGIRNGQ